MEGHLQSRQYCARGLCPALVTSQRVWLVPGWQWHVDVHSRRAGGVVLLAGLQSAGRRRDSLGDSKGWARPSLSVRQPHLWRCTISTALHTRCSCHPCSALSCVWSLVKQIVHLQLKWVTSVLIVLSLFRPHPLSLCRLAQWKGQWQSLPVFLAPQSWCVLCMAPKGKFCIPPHRGFG